MVVNQFVNKEISTLNLVRPQERGTFQDIFSELFNNLPDNVKTIPNYNLFCLVIKDILGSVTGSIDLLFRCVYIF